MDRFIDADSQVTAPWAELASEWLLSDRTCDLVDSGAISIGHSVFGELHHVVALVLRDLSAGFHEIIAKDISKHCQRFLGGPPDFVLFPGYSTISYFLENLSEIPSDQWIVLTPAFRSYGRFQLRLEMSGEQNRRIRSRAPLRMLFLDDSRSSGATEREALDAFVRTRVPVRKYVPVRESHPDKWLSYCILRRGIRWTPREPITKGRLHGKSSPLQAPQPRSRPIIKAESSYFCEIGPEASTTATCPFVDASRLVNAAIAWVSNCRPQIGDALMQVQDQVKPRQLTHRGPTERLLKPAGAKSFLHLCSLDLPRAARRIHNAADLDRNQLQAGLLFASLNYTDITSYLSHSRLFELFSAAALLTVDDSRYDATILLTSIAVLPTSIIAELTYSVLSALVQAGSPDTASALLALTFLSFDTLAHNRGHAPVTGDRLVNDALQSAVQSSGDASADEVEIIRRLRSEQVVAVNSTLHSLDSPDRRKNDVAGLVLRDMLAIGSGPGIENVVIVARKLASLLYPGDHGFFLASQLENLDSGGDHMAIRTMLQAVSLSRAFAAHLHVDVDDLLDDAERDIAELRSDSSTQRNARLRQIGMELRSSLWQIVFNPFCCSGKTWAAQLDRARDNAKLNLPTTDPKSVAAADPRESPGTARNAGSASTTSRAARPGIGCDGRAKQAAGRRSAPAGPISRRSLGMTLRAKPGTSATTTRPGRSTPTASRPSDGCIFPAANG